MIVILAVALIVVGPEKLPELARSLAKGVQELKKTANQVKESLTEEGSLLGEVEDELKNTSQQLRQHLLDAPDEDRIYRPDLSDTDSEPKESEDVIDVDDLEERPWEKDLGRHDDGLPDPEARGRAISPESGQLTSTAETGDEKPVDSPTKQEA